MRKPTRLVISAAFVLAQIAIAQAGLDLSPHSEPFKMEGITMSQLVFATGTNDKAIYQPPPEWKYSGDNDSLDLTPEKITQAKATVTKWPSSPPLSFDEAGRKQLTEKFVGTLPEGSQDVKVQSEAMNPLQIDGKQTYLVEITYTNYGAHFACYTLVMNRPPEPLCFRLTCREGDYDKLKEAFQRSLFSWQNL